MDILTLLSEFVNRFRGVERDIRDLKDEVEELLDEHGKTASWESSPISRPKPAPPAGVGGSAPRAGEDDGTSDPVKDAAGLWRQAVTLDYKPRTDLHRELIERLWLHRDEAFAFALESGRIYLPREAWELLGSHSGPNLGIDVKDAAQWEAFARFVLRESAQRSMFFQDGPNVGMRRKLRVLGGAGYLTGGAVWLKRNGHLDDLERWPGWEGLNPKPETLALAELAPTIEEMPEPRTFRYGVRREGDTVDLIASFDVNRDGRPEGRQVIHLSNLFKAHEIQTFLWIASLAGLDVPDWKD